MKLRTRDPANSPANLVLDAAAREKEERKAAAAQKRSDTKAKKAKAKEARIRAMATFEENMSNSSQSTHKPPVAESAISIPDERKGTSLLPSAFFCTKRQIFVAEESGTAKRKRADTSDSSADEGDGSEADDEDEDGEEELARAAYIRISKKDRDLLDQLDIRAEEDDRIIATSERLDREHQELQERLLELNMEQLDRELGIDANSGVKKPKEKVRLLLPTRTDADRLSRSRRRPVLLVLVSATKSIRPVQRFKPVVGSRSPKPCQGK